MFEGPIERLYFKSFEDNTWGKRVAAPDRDGEPFSTVAFFGLVRSGAAAVRR